MKAPAGYALKARTADLRRRGLGSGITSHEFEDAVCTFDIGQNDLQQAAMSAAPACRTGVSSRSSIPAIVTRIKNAVTVTITSTPKLKINQPRRLQLLIK
jgi:hypothetical protein